MEIGSVFYNVTDDGKSYLSLTIDDVVKEIYPILKELKFTLNEIPEEKRKENSPYYRLSCYKPKDKEKQ